MIHLTVTTTAHGFASACETLFPQIFGGQLEGKKKIGSILQKGKNNFKRKFSLVKKVSF